MQVKRAVAIGFATIDYVIELAEQFSGSGTRRIKQIPDGAWPRPGGAALYSCRQLAAAGIEAAPVTWTGTDPGAERYESACRQSAVGTDGIVHRRNGVTPACVLIYQPDGSYGCLFDSGMEQPDNLSVEQQCLLDAADLVLIAVGPPGLADDILAHVRPDALVAWIAKADDMAFPGHVRRKYAARADYIFCNEDERRIVESSLTSARTGTPVIIETRGRREVLVTERGQQFFLPVEPTETPDTTGAGDTLAGATMAQILNGQSDLRSAVEAGIRAATALLRERL